MNKVFAVAYTHCSDCGTFSGYYILKTFRTESSARQWAEDNPNPDIKWGSGTVVLTLDVEE